MKCEGTSEIISYANEDIQGATECLALWIKFQESRKLRNRRFMRLPRKAFKKLIDYMTDEDIRF